MENILPSSKIIVSQSAPTFAFFSEKGESLDIDLNTGLPKLPIEPPIDADPFPAHRKSVSFNTKREEIFTDMSKKSPSTSRSAIKQYSPLVHKRQSGEIASTELNSKSLDSMTSGDLRRSNRARHTMPLKSRSRSVFIRLQLPNNRTPPLSHRNLSVLESDSSDTDIQTAPIVETSKHQNYFHYDELGRRASDGIHLDKKISLSDLKSPQEESLPSPHPQVSSDSGDRCSTGRRGSYLYLSDADDEEQQAMRSRASSMNSHIGDETYVTPFAQILANLHRVRSQFLSLFNLPSDTRTPQTRVNPHTLPSPMTSPPKKLSDANQKKLIMQTLEEFDWCLKKLETVNSASMGTMAQDKFRRILSRELSHLSGKSKSGTHVAEWVENITNPDDGSSLVDRALDTALQEDEEDREGPSLEQGRTSGSLGHDVWLNMKTRGGKNSSAATTAVSASPGAEVCIRVPMFGVNDPKLDKAAMRDFMVHSLDSWDVDTFHLDTISAGNALTSASYLVLKKRDLFTTFKISPHIFINFISKIQSSYLPNPYHNQVHAADVLLATNHLLKAEALKSVFTDLEILAALVAAAIHDVGHPARTNQFLVNVQHDLAVLYNDNSVLENHHLALAFKILQDPQCNFIENFEREQRQAFRRMVIDMVLATDMSKHFKHLGELKTLLETQKVANDGILVLDKYCDRSEVLQCMIHCADLSNPTKREDLASDWSRRIMEENFLQGDEEKSLSIPLNPLGDREQVSLCKCQVTFIDFIVDPLWETWAELVYPDGQLMLDNISKTREYWNAMIDPNSPSHSEDSGGEEMTNPPHPILSNGSSEGERVSEVAKCDDLSGDLESSILTKTNSEELALLSDNVANAFSESPLADRRQSFQRMKQLKVLEGSCADDTS